MRNDRRDHVLNLLLEGNSPSGIAQKTAMPLGVVMNHLYNLVGQGRLRRSDVLFSIDPELRRTVEGAIAEAGSSEPRRVRRALQRSGAQLPAEDLDVYLRLRDARVDLGDMYEFIREIELKLHEFIRSSLMAEHGDREHGRCGLPPEGAREVNRAVHGHSGSDSQHKSDRERLAVIAKPRCQGF